MHRLLVTALALVPALPALAQEGWALQGQWRASAQHRELNTEGPLAQAQSLSPDLARQATASALMELTAQAHGHGVDAEVWLGQQATPGGHTLGQGRLNELAWSSDGGDWLWSLGKKRVGWDVGYAFRPNDLVAQEPRRTLLTQDSEGRPLVQVERFWGAEQALSVVWVNPQHAGGGHDDPLDARESALAARGYQRWAAADLYAFARWGRHTGTSAGAAAAWVATDALELHASWRALQRHDALVMDPTAAHQPVAANPWGTRTLGAASQWLLGATWTGQSRQSLLLEAWHDGNAPSDEQWRDSQQRSAALLTLAQQPTTPAALRTAVAGNLAWQTSPMSAANLRRDNLLARVSWQPEPWQWSLDLLVHPADRGQLWTAALQWQGDRWQVQAALRYAGGPADAVARQLPSRGTAVVAASLSF